MSSISEDICNYFLGIMNVLAGKVDLSKVCDEYNTFKQEPRLKTDNENKLLYFNKRRISYKVIKFEQYEQFKVSR